MRRQLDPRDAHEFGRHPAAGGDHVGDHQIGRELAKHRDVEHRHPRGALVDLGPGVGVVVVVGGIEPDQFDGLDSGRAGGVQPLGAGQQHRVVARSGEPQAQRERGKRMTRVRARHHRDSHSAYPATPAAPTLAYMTEQTANVSTDVDNAHTVEVFLSALQD